VTPELRASINAVADVLDEYDETGASWADDEVREAFVGVIADVRACLSELWAIYT
jgi:hypothetical protein